MIVGGGLIAKAFEQYSDSENLTIFASGVSNSLCSDEKEFIREKEMLMRLNRNTRVVYASTTSISDGSFENHYIRHKKEMEQIVQTFEDHLILRLPNVVGRGGNSRNLFNHLIKCLLCDIEVSVTDQYKSLIDADDLFRLTERIVLSDFIGIVDISLDNQTKVDQILSDIEKVYRKKFVRKYVDCQRNLPVNNSLLKQLAGEVFNSIDRSDYNIRLIEKYEKTKK